MGWDIVGGMGRRVVILLTKTNVGVLVTLLHVGAQIQLCFFSEFQVQ